MTAAPKARRRLTALEVGVAGAVIVSLFALLVIALTHEGLPTALTKAEKAESATDPVARREALEAMRDADPHQVATLEDLAHLARTQGRWRDAAAQWAEIAKLDPSHATAHFEEAQNLQALGDYRGVTEVLTGDGLSAEAQVLRATALLGLGRQAEAGVLADQVLAAEPGHVKARELKADLLFLGEDLDAAQAAYQALMDNPETRDAGHLGLVQVPIRRGDNAAALARLGELTPGPDASAQYLTARAELLRQLGQTDEAAAVYRTLLGRIGPVPESIVPLAELAAAGGQASVVEQLRGQIVGTTPPALAARHYLEAIASYLSQDPLATLQSLAWAETYFSRRDLYRWMELDAGASGGELDRVRAAAQAMSKDPNLPVVARERAADAVAQRAAEWADRGDQAKAAALARLADDLAPGRPAARLVLARAALVGGRNDEAQRLAQALVADPGARAGALEVLGRAALARDQFDVARDAFDDLAKALPEASTGPYWLGITAFRRGDYQVAVERLRQAYARNPDPRVESALIDALLQGKSYADADTLAQTLTKHADAATRARGWAYLAGIARAQGRLADAAAAYRKAMAEDPNRLPYALAAVDLLIATQAYPEAAEILAAAALKAPDNEVIGFKQAYVAHRAGDNILAIERYRKLLAKHPGWTLPMVNLSDLLGSDPATKAEALDLAGRAAKLSPRWVDAQWNLAQRLVDQGKDAQALAAAQAVLALSADHADAKALAKRLGGGAP